MDFFNKINLRFQKGQSVLEIIIAASIMAIIGGSAVIALLGSFSTIRLAQEESQATMIALEGTEAVNSIRDQNWDNLTNGDHGLSSDSGKWAFSGTSDTKTKYKRTATISDVYRENGDIVQNPGAVDPDTKKLTVSVSWNFSPARQNTIIFNQYLTNWQTARSKITSPTCTLEADCLIVTIDNAHLLNGNKDLGGITLGNKSTSNSITIDKMVVTWTGGGSGNKINVIAINGKNIFNGSGSSGQTLDITNTQLTAGSTNIPLDYIRFNKTLTGATVSVKFIMLDTSSKTTPAMNF